jgi:hypothetical protein
MVSVLLATKKPPLPLKTKGRMQRKHAPVVTAMVVEDTQYLYPEQIGAMTLKHQEDWKHVQNACEAYGRNREYTEAKTFVAPVELVLVAMNYCTEYTGVPSTKTELVFPKPIKKY